MGMKERNEGIDLLRIVAMFFVMILQTLSNGGLLYAGGDSVNTRVVWALQVIAFVAVDIFALISGYVGFTDQPKPFRVSKYFSLWLMVLTYGVILTIVEVVLMDGAASGIDIAVSFFPVTANLFWYFTAYTGLFLLMPLMNALVRMYSEERLRKIFIVIVILFCAYDFWAERIIPGKGYTMLWFVVLYFMGAIIKKCDIGVEMKNSSLILIIVLCGFFSWIWRLNVPGIHVLTISISGETMLNPMSPTVVASAVAYLLLFKRLRIKKEGDMHRFIRFSAPAVFAAYILGSHAIVWSHILPGKFAFLANRSALEMVGVVIAFSALFLGTSVLLERGRMALFELMRVRKGLDKLEDKVRGIMFRPKRKNLFAEQTGQNKFDV